MADGCNFSRAFSHLLLFIMDALMEERVISVAKPRATYFANDDERSKGWPNDASGIYVEPHKIVLGEITVR